MHIRKYKYTIIIFIVLPDNKNKLMEHNADLYLHGL